MSSVKISIVIPAFNSENYIAKCIDSIVNQTLKDIEIIVVNDASEDNTQKIIEHYASKDNRIKIINLETNSGQGFARNKGIELAQGQYIGFVDTDDYVDVDYFEKLFSTAQKYDSDIAVASVLKHKKCFKKYNVKYTKRVCISEIHKKMELCADTKKNFFYAWNKIYRTSFIRANDIKFAQGQVYEDVIFAIKALYYSNAVVSVPHTKYHYICRKESTINSQDDDKNKKNYDYVCAYEQLQKFARENEITLPERLNYYTSCWFNPFVKTYFGQYAKKDLLFGLIKINKEEINYDFPVDLVYCWVDGQDPVWREKKRYWQKQMGKNVDSQAIDDGRFIDNEELRFSLRAAEKYAPWLNKIYIVTDNQIPKWLDTSNPKVQVVFHKDFIPEENLPLFNSEAIESYLPYIPNLSEQFLYACDDMYIGKFINKHFFFDGKGVPIIRLKHQVSSKHIATSMYTRSILNLQRIIKERFGKSYPYAPHHNMDAYKKSDFIDCLNYFRKEFDITCSHKFRGELDIQRVIVSYYALAKGNAILKHYSRVDKFLSPYRRLVNKFNKIYEVDSNTINMNNKNPYRVLKKYNPFLFCTNDGEGITNFDRRRIRIFLEETFPEKSSFELD